jgi:hypothetical protein
MPITQAFLDKVNGTSFSSAADIDTYFTNNYQAAFISWFNANIGSTGNWATISIDPNSANYYQQLWTNGNISAIFPAGSMSVLQFLALQSIIITETGGGLAPVTELMGTAGHPGLAYAFDSIAGLKASYNQLPGNKDCYTLFNDANYNNAFNTLALYATLNNTADAATWQGNVYPQATVSYSLDPAQTGYVQQADFFKFRGRGLIQTTGRANYAPILQFVLNYPGNEQVVVNAKNTWTALSNDPDVVATMTADAEWTDVFMNSEMVVPVQGIAIHNQNNGDYLGSIDGTNPNTASTTILNVGQKVNGSGAYANTFLSRVTQIIEEMS